MPLTKTPYEVLELNFDVLMNLSTDADDFSKMWVSYLKGCGWTEEEFDLERDRRTFPPEQP